MQTPVDRAFARSVLTALLGAACLFLCDSPAIARGISPTAARQVREGTLEVLVADNFEAGSSRVLHDLITPQGERIPLRFEGAPVSRLKTGDRMRVTGRFVGETLVVERAEGPSGAKTAETATTASAWTIGPKRAIAILVNFLDDTSQPSTVSQAQTTMFAPSGSGARSPTD